jgi:FKBP-type peptidyl-prolyl cis-trans isomerase FklB
VRAYLALALPIVFLAACGQPQATEAPTIDGAEGRIPDAAMEMIRAEAALAQNNRAEAEAFLLENGKREAVRTTASGLQYLPVASGDETGRSPIPGEYVCVHYEGRLLDGSVFDSSLARGLPNAFPSDRLIRGWVEALALMVPGDQWQLYIHPDLAYGERGAGADIGPNAMLIFDVSLIGILGGPVPDGTDCSSLVQGALADTATTLNITPDLSLDGSGQ